MEFDEYYFVFLRRNSDNVKISEEIEQEAGKKHFEFIEEKIKSALNNDPQTQMINLIYQFQIFDTDTQKAFGEAITPVTLNETLGISDRITVNVISGIRIL